MSTKRKHKPVSLSRFQIRFENPEQSAAYVTLLNRAGRYRNDGTMIGGDELVRPRNRS